MANFFDQFDRSDANYFDQFDGSTISDVAQSAVGGVERGVLGIQGALGDVDRQIRRGGFALADVLGFGPGQTVADRLGLADTTNAVPPESILPSTQQLTNAYEGVAGPIHQPQTLAGEYARTAGEFAPAAFGGPATRLGKAAAVAVPAVLSETAGQITRRVSPENENTARALGGLLGSVATMKTRTVPSTDELQALKADAYQAFEAAGGVVSAKSFRGMVRGIVDDATSAGFDRGLHKQAGASLRRLADEFKVNKPRSLLEIDRLRRLVNGAGKVPDISADERRIISGMVDKLDDFVDALAGNPGAVVSGNARQAVESLKRARELNRQYRRSEMVDLMWERAGLRAGQFSVSGNENAIRTEFRQLGLRLARNPNLRRLFTKAERAAIGKVANPGNLENALRNLGKLAPKGSVPLFGGGLAIGHDPGGIGGLFGLGGASSLAASGMTNVNLNKARNALLGLPPQMVPVAPYLNPLAASAATLPERQP